MLHHLPNPLGIGLAVSVAHVRVGEWWTPVSSTRSEMRDNLFGAPQGACLQRAGSISWPAHCGQWGRPFS